VLRQLPWSAFSAASGGASLAAAEVATFACLIVVSQLL
jgi:hypothetical protein